jgi:hypothetical protein
MIKCEVSELIYRIKISYSMTEQELLQSKIDLAKKKYGTVFEIEIPIDDDGNTTTIYVKKASREILSIAGSLMSKDPMKANEVILKNCLIPELNDMTILDNEDIFLSACTAIEEIVRIRQATIKKK